MANSEHKVLRSIFNSILPVITETDENSITGHPQDLIRAIMIIGSIHTLKTALLFQAAVNQCHAGETTLFISQSPLNDLPSSIHGMPAPSQINMNFMTLVYIDDLGNLVKFLSSFHIEQLSIPLLIVIDNLDYYIEQMKDQIHLEQRCARLCALLQETANFCAQKRQSITGLFLGCKKNSLCVKLLHIFSHFFQTIWNINQNYELANSNITSFTVTQLYGNNADIEKVTACKHDDAIFVESIYFMPASDNADIT